MGIKPKKVLDSGESEIELHPDASRIVIKACMAENPPKKSDIATRIMERMVRMPPKPHSAMKLGKRKAKASTKANPPGKEGSAQLR
jgi:hypothetical protein